MSGPRSELVGAELGGKGDHSERNSQASMETAGRRRFLTDPKPRFASPRSRGGAFNMDRQERRVALVCHTWGHSSTFFTWNFTKQYLLRVIIFWGALAGCKRTI